MKSLIAFVLPLTSQAWTSLPSRSLIAPPHKTRCSLSSQSAETDTDNPCWQDIWNYDCAMSNIYSASFIAQDWIQSMPCAMGIEDCDTPENLKLPGPMEGSGVEQVDVMEFLNLKRAKSLKD